MPLSLNIKLAGKEAEIVNTIKESGSIDGTLRGGQKAMWLKQHRDLVLDFYNEFGPELTKQQFCLTHDTLGTLLKFEHKPYQPPFGKADKALALSEIAMEGQRAIRERMDKLEVAYAQFTQIVGQNVGGDFGQVVSQAVTLLLQSSIKVPPALEVSDKLDPLSIETLTRQG